MKKLLFSFAILSLVGCNGGNNQTNIELVTNMMDQISIKSQDWDPAQGDKVQMRMPPEHAISRETYVYQYATDNAGANKQPNPHAGDMSAEFLTKGAKYYATYCAVCHGDKGDGHGPVAEKMAVKPRNLINDEAKGYSDGRIYHAITAGYGVMGSYMSQITDADNRWAVVNYVRSLQKAQEK